MRQVQMTTYETRSSPAHVRLSLAEMMTELHNRGYRLLDVRANRNEPQAAEYIFWHPDSFTTVELYEEYPDTAEENTK